MNVELALPYHLRIGVTGHRNLPKEIQPAISANVQATLAHLQNTLSEASAHPFGPAGSQRSLSRRFDNLLAQTLRLAWRGMPRTEREVAKDLRTAILWTVVSSLAKGADRIVARAVLDLPPTQAAGVDRHPRLIAILPLPQAEYERDFVDFEDLKEFRELLARGSQTQSLHRDLNAEPNSDSQAVRNQAYFDAGQAVVDASEILVTVWNGKPAASHGGTAEIVRHAVDAGRVVLWINSEQPNDPAQLLYAKRNPSESNPSSGAIGDFATAPLPTRANQLSSAYHRLSAYNREPVADSKRATFHCGRKQQEYLAMAGNDPKAIAAATPFADRLIPLYVHADELAARYQKLHFLASWCVYGFSVAAIAVAAAQILLFPHELWIIGFEILFLIVAGAFVRVAGNERWKEKWLNDRHLAEWLRRRTFTLLLGQHYDAVHRKTVTARPGVGAESWYHNAFSPVIESCRTDVAASPSLAALKKFIVDGWIAPQAQWHDKNCHKRTHRSHAIHVYSWAIFVATLLVALLHMAGVGHGDSHAEHHTAGVVAQLIALAAILLPAVGAAFHAIAALHDDDRVAARSSQLAPMLRGLADRAQSAHDLEQLVQVVVEADHVIAHENDDWWVSIGAQPPVIPG